MTTTMSVTSLPVRDEVTTALVGCLQQLRQTKKNGTTSAKWRKPNVVPGRSVAAEDTPNKDDSHYHKKLYSDPEISRNICDYDTNRPPGSEECCEFEVAENEDKTTSLNHDWILVQYCTKKTVKHYMGKVLKRCPGQLDVKFLCKSETQFVWPLTEDLHTVEDSDVKKLPSPKTFSLMWTFLHSMCSRTAYVMYSQINM